MILSYFKLQNKSKKEVTAKFCEKQACKATKLHIIMIFLIPFKEFNCIDQQQYIFNICFFFLQ